jgi:RNA polymerase sigma-70 factor (ECF subfamily)
MNQEELEEKGDLRRRAQERGVEALKDSFARHAERLRRMVRLRLDRKLREKVRDSEVIEASYVEASRRLPRYLEEGDLPVFLWLRSVTGEVLLEIHRKHLGSSVKDGARTVVLSGRAMPEVKSTDLAAQLLGKHSFPSIAAMETVERLQFEDALDAIEENDRQVLILRHFERLSNSETARELGIEESSASKRYIRAILKLKEMESLIERLHLNDGPP